MHNKQLQGRKPLTWRVVLVILLVLKTLVICTYSLLEALVKLFIPKRRKSVRGEIVLITGAAHGLGRATAHEFAKCQSKLVLWDINKEGVEETAEECRKLGAIAHAFVVDCRNRTEIYSVADKVKKEIGDVSILINNAAATKVAVLCSTKDELIQNMFDINVLAHFWTVKAFLTPMIKNNHGHIVTVASFAGHLGIPYMVCYSSSKWSAVGFHESLKEELSLLKMDGIETTCMCPVFMNTDSVKLLKARYPLLEVEDSAKALMEGILTNQKMIFVPRWAKFHQLMKCLPERAYNTIMNAVMLFQSI
uniref:17-beta-hydroxysteroid dehydrogenase 13-like n=1 Tax=Podarcis muralis TaxID=64176 RepID=UPI00109FC0F3|nr:17-beta-hydroxysteroid dehydrogenase 13-like [Podarcis muralis]